MLVKLIIFLLSIKFSQSEYRRGLWRTRENDYDTKRELDSYETFYSSQNNRNDRSLDIGEKKYTVDDYESQYRRDFTTENYRNFYLNNNNNYERFQNQRFTTAKYSQNEIKNNFGSEGNYYTTTQKYYTNNLNNFRNDEKIHFNDNDNNNNFYNNIKQTNSNNDRRQDDGRGNNYQNNLNEVYREESNKRDEGFQKNINDILYINNNDGRSEFDNDDEKQEIYQDNRREFERPQQSSGGENEEGSLLSNENKKQNSNNNNNKNNNNNNNNNNNKKNNNDNNNNSNNSNNSNYNSSNDNDDNNDNNSSNNDSSNNSNNNKNNNNNSSNNNNDNKKNSGVQGGSKRNLIPEKKCGQDVPRRIIGGTKTDIDEFPWMGLLQYVDSSGNVSHDCSGVLISKRYVLTAAHCTNGAGVKSREMKLQRVRLGEWDISTEKDCQGDVCSPNTQEIEIEDIIPHKEYKPKDKSQVNDIALIRLKNEATLNQFVQPICLPFDKIGNTNYEGKKLTVSGWGKTSNARNSASNIKMKVDLPVVNWDRCRQFYNSFYGNVQIKESQFCAGGEEGQDSCRGDSGGPLMTTEKSENEIKWYVIGVVSSGPAACGMQDRPSLYTNVSQYTDWILDNIKN